MSLIPNRSEFWTLIEVTIASGAAVTANLYAAANGPEAVEAGKLGFRGLGVFTTDDWTAADLTIDTSLDGTTWRTERDENGDITRAVVNALTSGGFSVVFPAGPAWKAGAMDYVRLRSVNSASEADVNQGATRTLTVILMR